MKETFYTEKITYPDGRIKYVYPKGQSPQNRYYYTEKGRRNEIKKRYSEGRKQYLREYYKKNRIKIIAQVLKRRYAKRSKSNERAFV